MFAESIDKILRRRWLRIELFVYFRLAVRMIAPIEISTRSIDKTHISRARYTINEIYGNALNTNYRFKRLEVVNTRINLSSDNRTRESID